MKICFFLSDITKVGGIERVISTLTNQLAGKTDYQIDIVSIFKGRSKPNYPINEKVNLKYISTEAHSTKPHSFKRIVNLVKNLRAIRSFFKKEKYDIIAAQSFPPSFSLALTSVPKHKIIAVEHVYAAYYGRLTQRVRAYIYKKFARTVVLTNNDKIFLSQYITPERICVIPNPVRVSEKYKSALNSKRIISVGRLEHQKGYDTLISIFKDIYAQYPEWSLDIYGDGSLKESLSETIKQSGLESVVKLHGHTDDINSKFRKSAFFVMSSRFEGFPMVLVEAMTQGLPCVSFDCPNGPSDIITNKVNGILVPNQDIQGLKDAIIMLIEDEDRRRLLGEKALESVDNFSEQKVAQSWDTLFNQIFDNGKEKS